MFRKRNPNGEAKPRKRPGGKWEVRVPYTDANTGIKKSKSLYAETQKEVLEKKKEFLASLEEGVFTPATKWTIAGWLAVWIKEYTKHLSHGTRIDYEGIIRNHITPVLGPAKLRDLTPTAVQSFFNGLGESTAKREALSPSTINVVKAALSSALKTAVELKYMPSNPVSLCKTPRIPKPDTKPMNEAYTARFLAAVKGDEYERALLLSLYTGLRRGELVGLSWDCINYEEGTIRVYRQLKQVKGGYEFGPPKGKRARTITPPPSAMQLLRELELDQKKTRLRSGKLWSNPDRLIFTRADGSNLCPDTVLRHCKRLAAKIGLPDLVLHDLRSTYATTSLHAGTPMKEVSDTLGHSKISTTAESYLAPTERMKKESADRLENFFNSLKI